MAKRKKVLNAALKSLLAGAETSAAIKIPATFISELASLPVDKQKVLAELSQEQFNELLTQSELATINAASSAADTKQIRALLKELIRKVDVVNDKLEKNNDPVKKKVAITPTSIRLHSGEWQMQTPITVTNRGSVPAYCVVLKILIHGQGVTASSLEVEADPQVPPLEAEIGNIIVSADQLRLNCTSKDGQQIVLLILHTVPAQGSRTISIKGTMPFNSSADVAVVAVDEKPQELLTRRGQEFAVMFKPTEDLVVNEVKMKMRRQI